MMGIIKILIIDNFINFLKTHNEINITEFYEIIIYVNINENFKSNKENENFFEEKSISEFCEIIEKTKLKNEFKILLTNLNLS